jgi:hypothetical protein
MRHSSALRFDTADAVFAAVVALVLLPVHGLVLLADRTSLRNLLVPARPLEAGHARRRTHQPGQTWTITRELRTIFSRAAVRHSDARRAPHTLNFRHTPPAESPGRWFVAAIDETRTIDQRESARDAGRHYRGRPAR